MQSIEPIYRKAIFVCTNNKDNNPEKCGCRGSEELLAKMKEYVKANNLQKKIRITKSGCMDLCGKGPIVCIMPDYKFFQNVEEKDLEKIIKTALKK